MSLDTPTERSPKRRRTQSPDRGYSRESSRYHTPANGSTPYHASQYDGAADLSFAYDEEDATGAAGTGSAVRTPEELRSSDEDEEEEQTKVVERPKTLDYKLHMTLRGHKRGVASVKYSPDGKWIASCSADCTLKIWSARTGELQHTLEGHLAGISALAWSPDSRVLASGSDDKLIRLWDTATGKPHAQPLVGHHNYIYSLAFSPKGNILVSGSYDEAVFLWDVRTARLMRSLPAHSDPVSGVDFVRDGTLVASCSSDGLIRVWDTATGQCLKTLVHEDNAKVGGVRFSPNGRYVLAATLDSCLRLWDYVDGRCVKTYQGHKNEAFSVSACFGTYGARDGGEEEVKDAERWAFAACGSEEGNVVLWDVSSKEILQTLRGHEGVVLGVDVCAQDQAIVTCGVDKTIRVWRRSSGISMRHSNGHTVAGAAHEDGTDGTSLDGLPNGTSMTSDARLADGNEAKPASQSNNDQGSP